MIVFEILKFNRELIDRLQKVGFKIGDDRYIDLYEDYERMKKDGEKMTYIVSYLSLKYNVSERKVYDIVKFHVRSQNVFYVLKGKETTHFVLC